MNSYKLNGKAGHAFRLAIISYFNIHPSVLYRSVKDINNNMIIMSDNKVYELTLKEIKYESSSVTQQI